jgi:Zn-dependent protease
MQARLVVRPRRYLRRSHRRHWWLRLTVTEKKILLWPATIASFSLVFSWQFIPVAVALLVIHEQGHVWAANRVNLRHSGHFPIPFVGGGVWIYDVPTLSEDTFVSLMGAVFGMAGALVALTLGLITDSIWLKSVAVIMAEFNLLNLLPIGILDGGHVLRSLAFSLHRWVGSVAMIAVMLTAEWLFLTTRHWALGCILLISIGDAVITLLSWWVRPLHGMPEGYQLMGRLAWWQVLVYLLAYLALIMVLSVVVWYGLAHQPLQQTVRWWFSGPSL